MFVTASTFAPPRARRAHRGEGVRGLARLRDSDHQVPGADDRVAVAVLGRDVDLDRHASPGLDRVAADQAGVIRRAAGDHHDPPHPPQEVIVDRPHLAEVDPIHPRRALADRLRHRVSLLVDLLQHERLVALLLGRLGVPVDLDHLALQRFALSGQELDPLGAQDDDLVVVDVLDLAGLAQECRYRGGDELLAVAATDDQRALLACADDQAGLVGAHRDERVMAAKLGVRGADGLHEVAVVVARDEVGDHLGIGLRGEHGALPLEAVLQRQVVLHDPVDHDMDAIGGVEVRVGVLLGHASVRRPARVADPGPHVHALGDRDRARPRVPLVESTAEVAQVADGAHGLDPVTVQNRDAGAVVTAVLELLEPGQ